MAVISAAKTACENQTNQAYLDLRVVTDDLQEQHSRHGLAVASLAAYAQQQPNLTELLGPKLDQLVADSLAQDPMMTNLWLAPGGVVTSIFPLPGYEDFIGLDLFQVQPCSALIEPHPSSLIPTNTYRGGMDASRDVYVSSVCLSCLTGPRYSGAGAHCSGEWGASHAGSHRAPGGWPGPRYPPPCLHPGAS